MVAGPGTVVLDIGGDVGAAVVIAGPAQEGCELEIRAAGETWSGRHVAFHPRRSARGSSTAAVFPRLEAGEWEVRLQGARGAGVVLSVTGGAVTTVSLSRPGSESPPGDEKRPREGT